MLDSDRFQRNERAAAIQSMGILLDRRKQQQKCLDYLNPNGWDANVGGGRQLANWTDENSQNLAAPRSILKSNNGMGCLGAGKKEVHVDLNNNDIKPPNNRKGKGGVLRWKEEEEDVGKQHQPKEWAPTKMTHEEAGEEEPFHCCSVCGGRLWAGDQKSTIFDDAGHQQMDGNQGQRLLVVHWDCFRCATCGLDLGPEPQGKVFKKDGRFYCHLHGPTALALATIAQNGGGQQKKDGKSMKNGTVPNGFNGGDLGRHHYQKRQMTKMENVPAPMAHPKQMMALEKHPPELAKEEEEEEKSQREWWERNADEFNGNKKSSTTIRYYGAGAGNIKAVEKLYNTENFEREKQRIYAVEKSKWAAEKDRNAMAKSVEEKPQYPTAGTNAFQTDYRKSFANADAKRYDGKSSSSNNNNNNWKMNKTVNMAAIQKENNNNNGNKIDDKLIDQQDHCQHCGIQLSGSFVLAKGRSWCPDHFTCANSACARPLLASGFVEEPAGSRRNYCPKCYELLIAPICQKCSLPLTESCLNAMGQKWHPDCFCCTHCRKPFGTLSFFIENGKPYCEHDWNKLFTTKCDECHEPIKVGQKCLEALGGRCFHGECFKCTTCQIGLEGKTFFEVDQRPYCRAHAIQQHQRKY